MRHGEDTNPTEPPNPTVVYSPFPAGLQLINILSPWEKSWVESAHGDFRMNSSATLAKVSFCTAFVAITTGNGLTVCDTHLKTCSSFCRCLAPSCVQSRCISPSRVSKRTLRKGIVKKADSLPLREFATATIAVTSLLKLCEVVVWLAKNSPYCYSGRIKKAFYSVFHSYSRISIVRIDQKNNLYFLNNRFCDFFA